MVAIAMLFTHWVGPAAAGSGIPTLKVILSDVEVPNYFSAWTLCSKVIGLIIARGSGLFVGA